MATTESTGELTTISGLPLDPVYTPDTTPIDYERDLGVNADVGAVGKHVEAELMEHEKLLRQVVPAGQLGEPR